jgi:hypothetical protein
MPDDLLREQHVRPVTRTRRWDGAATLLAITLLAAGPALGQARGENCEVFLHTLPNASASLGNSGSGATALVGVTAGQSSPAGAMSGPRSGRRAELGFWGTVDVMSVPEPSHGALALAALAAVTAIGGTMRRARFVASSRGSDPCQRRLRARRVR